MGGEREMKRELTQRTQRTQRTQSAQRGKDFELGMRGKKIDRARLRRWMEKEKSYTESTEEKAQRTQRDFPGLLH
jgi:hypothetical protein